MAKKKEEPDDGTLEAELRKTIGNTPTFGPVPYWLPTGIDLLDWTIGQDGFPCGRVIEVSGPEGSGKTLIALSAARECIALKGHVYYIDVEHGLEEDWVRKNGIDPYSKQFHPEEPFYIEDALNAVELIVIHRKDAEAPTLIVYDTIAGGVAKQDSMEVRTMSASQVVGKRATLFTDFFKREAMGYLRNSKICLLFLNHQKMSIPTGPVRFSRPTTPGGSGPKFAAALRIRVEAEDAIKQGSDGQKIGQFVNCRVIKNKVDRPERRCSFPVFWNGGPDPDMGLIYYLVKEKILADAGGWLTWDEKRYRRNGLRDAMRDDASLRGEILTAAQIAFRKEWS